MKLYLSTIYNNETDTDILVGVFQTYEEAYDKGMENSKIGTTWHVQEVELGKVYNTNL